MKQYPEETILTGEKLFSWLSTFLNLISRGRTFATKHQAWLTFMLTFIRARV